MPARAAGGASGPSARRPRVAGRGRVDAIDARFAPLAPFDLGKQAVECRVLSGAEAALDDHEGLFHRRVVRNLIGRECVRRGKRGSRSQRNVAFGCCGNNATSGPQFVGQGAVNEDRGLFSHTGDRRLGFAKHCDQIVISA